MTHSPRIINLQENKKGQILNWRSSQNIFFFFWKMAETINQSLKIIAD